MSLGKPRRSDLRAETSADDLRHGVLAGCAAGLILLTFVRMTGRYVAVAVVCLALAMIMHPSPAGASYTDCWERSTESERVGLDGDLRFHPGDPNADPMTGVVADNGSAGFRIEPTRVVFWPNRGWTVRGGAAWIKPRDGSNSGRIANRFESFSVGTRSIALGADEYVYDFGVATDKPGCFHSGERGDDGATAPAPTDGYWLMGRDGGIFSFGNAPFFGSTGGMRLNQPVVAISPTPSGDGYWIVASDGGIFSFGDAQFAGSTGGLKLNQPIVGMASTPSGAGYWLLARDGGVFTFGDASYAGSAVGMFPSDDEAVGIAPHPSGLGYWIATRGQRLFAFGSAPTRTTNFGIFPVTVVGIAASPNGNGGWAFAAENGAAYSFGGSNLGVAEELHSPIVSGAVDVNGDGYGMLVTTAFGEVRALDGAIARGSVSDLGVRLAAPIVGLAVRPS